MGGGNWLTQSQPTNFHQFYKRKMLDANETPDSYREVTNAEKAALEASDAQWVRPEQWVIDRFNAWCTGTVTGQKFNVGGYNKATRYFECNGIFDIKTEEAEAMLEYAFLTRFAQPNHTENRWIFKTQGYHTVRTLFPICFVNSGTNSGSAVSMFNAWSKLEVVHFVASNFSSAASIFNSCNKLRRVTGRFAASNLNNAFWRCYDLEHVEIYNLSTDVSFADSSKLDSESLYFICSNKNNTNKVTVTVHPTTFALLTDEENEEWYPLIELAQTKNITFVSA